MLRLAAAFSVVSVVICSTAAAQDVRITATDAERSIVINGTRVAIGRIQDTNHRLSGEYTKTSRPCPPFCITPMVVAPGVETVGELELMDFLESHVATGRGLLLDTRVPEWFAKGSVPGAINLPFNTLDPQNPYRDDILRALGGVDGGSGWNFASARDLLLFCNGPWCDQTPRAIRNLLDAGYPPEKLLYYRGGMQVWQQLGLTVASKGSTQ